MFPKQMALSKPPQNLAERVKKKEKLQLLETSSMCSNLAVR